MRCVKFYRLVESNENTIETIESILTAMALEKKLLYEESFQKKS